MYIYIYIYPIRVCVHSYDFLICLDNFIPDYIQSIEKFHFIQEERFGCYVSNGTSHMKLKISNHHAVVIRKKSHVTKRKESCY